MRRGGMLLMTLLAGCASTGPGGLSWEAGPDTPQLWTETRLAPELVASFRDHPRFRGETLAVGLPPASGAGQTRLDRQLAERLEARLLEETGLRVLPPADGGCGSAAAYRIGYVTRVTGSTARIEARVWDAVAGEWVTGVGGRWRGSLQGGTLAAARAPASDGLPGSEPGFPLPAADLAATAEALATGLACELRQAGSVPGRIVASDSDHALENLTAGRLAGRLRTAETGGPGTLSLVTAPASGNVRVVMARLVYETGQVTASVYQRTSPPVAAGAAAPVPAEHRRVHLTALACGEDCLGVRVRSSGDSLLLAVLEGRGLFSLEGCERRRITDTGTARSIRIVDPDVAWASFYGVSAGDGSRVRLRELANGLPSACNTGPGAAGRETVWLDELARLVEDPEQDIAWDALRVVPGSGEGRL